MKKILLLFFTFCLSVLYQSQITYTLLDEEFDAPVVNAQILNSERKSLTITDINGQFKLDKSIKFIIIDALEYEEKYVELNPNHPILKLQFERVLSALEIKSNGNEARKLIKEVIRRKKANHPDNLDSYQFVAYNKFNFDLEPDSLKVDYEKMAETKDSSDYLFKKLISKSSLFLWERVEEHKHKKGWGDKVEITAQRISGFKNPIYEVMASQPLSLYMENDEFTFFFKKYPNPVSRLGLEEFKYNIVDTTEIEGRKTITVNFSPKNPKKAIKPIVGYVNIDVETKSVAQFYTERTKSPFMFMEMNWKERNGYFFPESQHFVVQLYNNLMIKVEGSGAEIDSYDNGNEENVPTWMEYVGSFKDFEIPAQNLVRNEFRGYEFETSKDIQEKSNEVLNQYRDPITQREQNTYYEMDSVFEKHKVERTLKYRSILTRGTIPLGNKLELDWLKLFQFNDYEGFRPEVNLVTNEKFHPKLKLRAYGAYGFKDKDFKWGSTVSYLVHPRVAGNIFAEYNDDVYRMGRFTPELFYDKTLIYELINSYYFQNYYHSNRISAGYEQDFFQNVTTRFYMEYAQNKSLTPYSYNFNDPLQTYDFVNGHIVLVWKPFDHYFKTPYGKVTVEKKPTYLGMHIMKSFDDWGSDFDFESIEFIFNHKVDNFIGNFEVYLKGGYLWGNAPLYYNFEGSGNARPKKYEFFRDLKFSGFKLFETLQPSRFNMDRYMSFQLYQSLPKFSIGKKKIETVIGYKGLWGDQDNTKHVLVPLAAPTEYYQEASLEFHKLFTVFGLGGFYRLGNYSVGNFKDDFYLKLNFVMPF